MLGLLVLTFTVYMIPDFGERLKKLLAPTLNTVKVLGGFGGSANSVASAFTRRCQKWALG
jgi:hypothetical protein